MKEFEVFIEHVKHIDLLNVYIFKNDHNGKRSICTSMDKMEFVFADDGYAVEPTFKLSGFLATQFLQAFANELNKIGIVADGEPVIKNELASTKYHLEDMRKIAFSFMSNKHKG